MPLKCGVWTIPEYNLQDSSSHTRQHLTLAMNGSSLRVGEREGRREGREERGKGGEREGRTEGREGGREGRREGREEGGKGGEREGRREGREEEGEEWRMIQHDDVDHCKPCSNMWTWKLRSSMIVFFFNLLKSPTRCNPVT